MGLMTKWSNFAKARIVRGGEALTKTVGYFKKVLVIGGRKAASIG